MKRIDQVLQTNVKTKLTDEDYHIANECGLTPELVYEQRMIVKRKQEEVIQHGDEPVCSSCNNTGLIWRLVDGMATATPCHCGRFYVRNSE